MIIPINRKIEVCKFAVPPYAREDSRAFMKHAVEQIAKHMIANGCLQLNREYDIARQGEWQAYFVATGSPERKPLP